MNKETALRLLLLVLALNVIRYVVVGPMEQVTLMGPMHRGFVDYPDTFNADFGTNDFIIGLVFNFVMWVCVLLIFHFMQASLPGPLLMRSVLGFALCALLFVSIAAVYMNHFRDHIKFFFVWSMVDALMVFVLVGIANGLLYPLLVPARLRPGALPASSQPGDDPDTV